MLDGTECKLFYLIYKGKAEIVEFLEKNKYNFEVLEFSELKKAYPTFFLLSEDIKVKNKDQY